MGDYTFSVLCEKTGERLRHLGWPYCQNDYKHSLYLRRGSEVHELIQTQFSPENISQYGF